MSEEKKISLEDMDNADRDIFGILSPRKTTAHYLPMTKEITCQKKNLKPGGKIGKRNITQK